MSIPPTPKMSRVNRKNETQELQTAKIPVPPQIHSEAETPNVAVKPPQNIPAIPGLPQTETNLAESVSGTVSIQEPDRSSQKEASDPWKIIFFVVLAFLVLEMGAWVYLLFFR